MHHDISQSAMVAWLHDNDEDDDDDEDDEDDEDDDDDDDGATFVWRFPFEFMISMPILQ